MTEELVSWRNIISDEEKLRISHGRYDFHNDDFVPEFKVRNESYFKEVYELRVLNIKEYDPIVNEKNFSSAQAYEYFEGDLNEVSMNKNRNERLSPELNTNEVLMLDGKFMLIQDRNYRVYFDFIDIFPKGSDSDTALFDIIPTAKALNYGFIFQTPIAVEKNFNPVVPFFDKQLGYILSTNMFTPVTVNIATGTKIAMMMRK